MQVSSLVTNVTEYQGEKNLGNPQANLPPILTWRSMKQYVLIIIPRERVGLKMFIISHLTIHKRNNCFSIYHTS